MFIKIQRRDGQSLTIRGDDIRRVGGDGYLHLCDDSVYQITPQEAARIHDILVASNAEIMAEPPKEPDGPNADLASFRDHAELTRDINDRVRRVRFTNERIIQLLTAVSRGKALFPHGEYPRSVTLQSVYFEDNHRCFVASLISPEWEPVPAREEVPFIEPSSLDWIECEVKPVAGE